MAWLSEGDNATVRATEQVGAKGNLMSAGPDEPPESSRQFKGEITVASRIIDYLSSGLYKDPAACLKELVNNSYDADATLVRLFVKPDADRIIIEDNGLGITQESFERHFKRISESHKRDEGDVTPSGRPMIGKIGIGFIAANEICEEMEIYSTAQGSQELLHVTIDFARMREDPALRRDEQGNITKADYHGELLEADSNEHYTQVFLKKVRGHAREMMAGLLETAGSENSLYGLKPETVLGRLTKITSWTELDDYSRTMLGVALNVPVRYGRGWISRSYVPKLRPFIDMVRELNFSVQYDGTELVKPIVLTGDSSNSLVKVVEFNGENVAARGWFYGQHGVLRPEDINGVLIRIRNAAVGEYDHAFLGFPHAEGTLFQRWVTAEIYADDRLEDALNIDRRTLREAHPAYVELRQWFHEELSVFLRKVRSELYSSQAQERKRERRDEQKQRIRDVARDVGRNYGDELGKRIEDAWTPPEGQRQPSEANLMRKFTVSELYEIVLEVARDTLPPDNARAFVDELTRRLRG